MKIDKKLCMYASGCLLRTVTASTAYLKESIISLLKISICSM
jgi:hypothetical protein